MKRLSFPAFILFVLFTASQALAADTPTSKPKPKATPQLVAADKVVKVLILKPTKVPNAFTGGRFFSFKNFELKMPNDGEMEMAKKAIEDAGFKPEDLKMDEGIPLEMILLEVKRPYPDQPFTAKDEVNGIPVLKPTAEEVDEKNRMLDLLKGLEAVMENFDFQFGFGGAPALSTQLPLSYHTGNNFFLGMGYQFTPNFETVLNFELEDFPSANDARTGGFDLNDQTLELLFKYRVTSDGVRPYLFAGPAVTESHFDGSFTFESFQGSVSYRDSSHFSLAAGAGFEIPLGKGHFFVQGEVIWDYLTPDTANFAQLDSTITFLPIQVGMLFGK